MTSKRIELIAAVKAAAECGDKEAIELIEEFERVTVSPMRMCDFSDTGRRNKSDRKRNRANRWR